jgi:murein L,D-transpeptidase YafK
MRRFAPLAFAALALVVPARADDLGEADPEVALRAVYREVGAARLDAALAQVERLLDRTPNFRLAHLVRGDLLLAQGRGIDTFGAAPGAKPGALADLRDEAQRRQAREASPPPADRIPAALLRLADSQRHALVVDVERARLMVYEQGEMPRLVADFYASHGKQGAEKNKEGDQRTPTGVYDVVGYLPDGQLVDLYGSGAFPINYPNQWDAREGRDGYGIWLHGTPRDTFARPPRTSDGCVVLSNADLERLKGFVAPGSTPVIIGTRIEYLSPEDWRAARAELETAIETWRQDWESRDADRYLAHYARGFRSGDQDLSAWSAHKRRVNAAKSHIQVGLGELAILRDPDEPDLAVVTFEQDYRSSNLAGRMHKRQYWVREDGAWRIAWEGDLKDDGGKPLNR